MAKFINEVSNNPEELRHALDNVNVPPPLAAYMDKPNKAEAVAAWEERVPLACLLLP